MTSPDIAKDEAPFSAKRYFLHLALWSTVLAVVLVAWLVAIGVIVSMIEERSLAAVWHVLVAAPIALAGSYGLWRTMPDFTLGEPNTPRGNRMRWLLAAIVLVGVAVALPINLAGPDLDGRVLWSNAPLPQTPALIAMLVWGLATPALIVAGRGVADEHARAAGEFGAMVGFQTFVYAAPLWWVGWRGGMLPQPDVMILFVATCIATTVANLWRRFA